MKSIYKVLLVFVTLCNLVACKHSPSTERDDTKASNQIKSNSVQFDSNYTHVVYFWFKDPEDTQGRALFESSLKTFLQQSKFAKTNFIGTPPIATRDVVDGSFTYSLILTFESAVAQQAYQEEDAHKIFIDQCAHLWEKVIVYDARGID